MIALHIQALSNLALEWCYLFYGLDSWLIGQNVQNNLAIKDIAVLVNKVGLYQHGSDMGQGRQAEPQGPLGHIVAGVKVAQLLPRIAHSYTVAFD